MGRGETHDPKIIQGYLSSGKYPRHATEAKKRSIRRTAKTNYKYDNGQLMYRTCGALRHPPASQERLRGGKVFGSWRKVIFSQEEQSRILESLHSSTLGGHFGRDKTLAKCSARYFWPAMASSITEFIRHCPTCQTTKPKPKVQNPELTSIAVHPAPWDKICVDFIGPLPKTANGNRYILTVTDYFSKWAEAKALPSKHGAGVAEFLTHLFLQHGFPRVMITDQGTEFENKALLQVCIKGSIDHRRTSAYHPQCNQACHPRCNQASHPHCNQACHPQCNEAYHPHCNEASHPQCNGLAERFNQTLTNQLLKATQELKDWDTKLEECLFAYRTTKQSSTGFTPFRLFYRREARLPQDNDARNTHDDDDDDADGDAAERT